MPRSNSPVRWDKIKEAWKFLRDLDLTDATAEAKLFWLFKNRQNIESGLSLKETIIIIHPEKVNRDPEGKILFSIEVFGQIKEEIRQFRKKMKKHAIVLYCMKHNETGAQIYFNIPTHQLYDIIKRRIERIIKGMRVNERDAISLLNLSKRERNKIAKLHADEQRRILMERIKKQLEKRRQKEFEDLQQSEQEGETKNE